MPLSPEIRSKILHVYLKRDKHTLTNISDLKDYIELGQGLKVTADELTSMWEEYTNLQTQSAAAAAAPAAFFSSARTSRERSILDDINIMLDILKQRAALVANKPYVEGNTWTAVGDDTQNYIECTQVSVQLEETPHDVKRLYAITQIINRYVSNIQRQKERELTLHCRDYSDRLTLQVSYTTAAKQQSSASTTPLLAPIARFPFDELKHVLNDSVMEVFSNWQQDENNSNLLFMKYEGYFLLNHIYNNLYLLQEAYREIDKTFNVQLINKDSPQIISVNKNKMNQLSRIITGKDLVIEPSLQERPAISPR